MDKADDMTTAEPITTTVLPEKADEHHTAPINWTVLPEKAPVSRQSRPPNPTELATSDKAHYLGGGRGGKDQDVGDGGVSGRLQGAVGALLFLLLERVSHHLEAGVHLHGNHAGAAHTGRLWREGALGAHVPHTTTGCLQVPLSQQSWPTCWNSSDMMVTVPWHYPD